KRPSMQGRFKQRGERSADALVREFLHGRVELADEGVRAPFLNRPGGRCGHWGLEFGASLELGARNLALLPPARLFALMIGPGNVEQEPKAAETGRQKANHRQARIAKEPK